MALQISEASDTTPKEYRVQKYTSKTTNLSSTTVSENYRNQVCV